MSKPDVSTWLRGETPHHLELLTKLRETITASLSARVELDGDGRKQVIPADVNDRGTPNRDWCRAYGQYRSGYETLLSEERERAKLLVLAQRGGQAPMTDEEYEREMRQLGLDAVRELDDATIARELERRGLTQAAIAAGAGPDESD